MWQSDRNCWIHLGEYLMHAWLDFSQTAEIHFLCIQLLINSEEYKILDAVVPDELHAANVNAGSYQMEEYKNKSLVLILHCLNTTTTQHFHYLYVLPRKSHKINAVCFPSFHNGCKPAYKVWRRLRTGELPPLTLVGL